MAKSYQKRVKKEVNQNPTTVKVPTPETTGDVVLTRTNTNNHAITIITGEKWYKRIWNYITNPFTYLFGGKIRYKNMDLPKYPKTREEWQDIGFLENVPEDRKDKLTIALNILMETVHENEIHSDDTEFIVASFPIIRRVVRAVDVDEVEIPRLYNEIRQAYKEFRTPENLTKLFDRNEGMTLDYESEFMCNYADEIIKRLQK